MNTQSENSLVEAIALNGTALTVPQLAKMLTISKRAIYDHVQSGRLPSIRIGTAVRLDPKQTAAWLAQRSLAA